jgi:hypothetical protein
MPTNKPQTRTLVLPDLADRFTGPPLGSPPDGYVLTWSAADGYFLPKPSTKLQVISQPSSFPYNIGNEDVVEVQTHAGTVVVNLPSSPLPGTNYYIKDFAGVASTNPISIATTQLVDTQNPYQITNNFGCVRVVFNGVTWSVIAKV